MTLNFSSEWQLQSCLLGNCINHVFDFLYSDALIPGGTAPPRNSQFLEIVNNFPMSVLFEYKPTNIEPTLRPPPASSSHMLSHYSSALVTLGPGARQPGTDPVPQSPLKLFRLANPSPTSPASPIPSCGNHNKGFRHSSSLSLLLMTQCGASPCGPL